MKCAERCGDTRDDSSIKEGNRVGKLALYQEPVLFYICYYMDGNRNIYWFMPDQTRIGL
jgi:hypothetical protein